MKYLRVRGSMIQPWKKGTDGGKGKWCEPIDGCLAEAYEHYQDTSFKPTGATHIWHSNGVIQKQTN